MSIDGADVAAVQALEPQVRALGEAIKAALPAAERLARAGNDGAGCLFDNLLDAVDEVGTGNIAGILDAFSTFGLAAATR
jgi:hypothetical protein